jgi:hypothetical protein
MSKGRGFAIGLAVLAFAALALAACGSGSGTLGTSSSGGSSGGGSGGGSGGSSGGSSGSSGTPGVDAAVEADSGAVDAPRVTGTFFLQAYGGPSGQVAAEVGLAESGVGPSRNCDSPVEAGACKLTSCKLGGIGSPSPGYGDIGPVSASVGTTTVPLVYNFTGYGTVGFPTAIALGTGGTMTFHGGDGARAPVFEVSATIPGLAVMTSPVSMAEASGDRRVVVIDSAQDLAVTWLPISIGHLELTLYGGSLDVGGTSVSIACTFAGPVGAGVVSHTLLSSLKQISGTNITYGDFISRLEATTVVDGLTIVTESYQSSATRSDFDITLQ